MKKFFTVLIKTVLILLILGGIGFMMFNIFDNNKYKNDSIWQLDGMPLVLMAHFMIKGSSFMRCCRTSLVE